MFFLSINLPSCEEFHSLQRWFLFQFSKAWQVEFSNGLKKVMWPVTLPCCNTKVQRKFVGPVLQMTHELWLQPAEPLKSCYGIPPARMVRPRFCFRTEISRRSARMASLCHCLSGLSLIRIHKAPNTKLRYHYRATGAVQTTLSDGTELYQSLGEEVDSFQDLKIKSFEFLDVSILVEFESK